MSAVGRKRSVAHGVAISELLFQLANLDLREAIAKTIETGHFFVADRVAHSLLRLRGLRDVRVER
jgi:hypothetical protein